MKTLLTGIAIFAVITILCFAVLTTFFDVNQGVAAIIGLVIGGLCEWLFHRNVNRS
ncbi:hypothetical protein [Alteribacter aurantiacus]|uniref:hypothetical protein n=1 Tax=Alteribacter aurantiacus TaxID=254410 RepID=UPI00042A651D|nr:hypothetical protein [Alteribacter aurantiacus]